MRTKTSPATGITTPKKTRPVTVTIEGELAATIREGAKQMGFRADTWARQCMTTGDLVTSDTAEAKEFCLNMALHALCESGRQFVEVIDTKQVHSELTAADDKLPILFPAKLVGLLEAMLVASNTGISLHEYAAEFLSVEIIDSCVPGACGVPEILDGTYRLEDGDREAMAAVVAEWKEQHDDWKAML